MEVQILIYQITAQFVLIENAGGNMINIYQGQIEIAHCTDRVWIKLGYRLSSESAKNDIKRKERELKKHSDFVIMNTMVVKMKVYK